MKVAKVRSTAGLRSHNHTVPSTGSAYHFLQFTEGYHWLPLDNVEEAAYFDDHQSFVVKWTPAGRIARAASGPIESVKDVLKSLTYRDKQQLAKDRGIKANQSEEALEAELEEVVADLARQLEHQH